MLHVVTCRVYLCHLRYAGFEIVVSTSIDRLTGYGSLYDLWYRTAVACIDFPTEYKCFLCLLLCGLISSNLLECIQGSIT